MMDLITQLKHARRASVPLVAIQTADPGATIRQIAQSINGGAEMVAWDVVRGTRPVTENAVAIAHEIEGREPTIGNPVGFLAGLVEALPSRCIAFMQNAHDYLEGQQQNPSVIQGIWNLRDELKHDARTLILLAPILNIPLALHDDVVVLDEALPDEDQLKAIVKDLDTLATEAKPDRPAIAEKELTRAVEAVTGLSAFAAEQAIAMAIRPDGIDLDHVWQSKIKQIELTRGLSVHRGGGKFSDLGGLEQIKQYLSRLMTGRRPPKVIVWLDEIEKTGLAAREDMSGVNQDQEGTLLQFMEDNDVYGVFLLGVPGCGKSQLCKAVGSEFNRIVLRIDLGAMQGSLVGESQQTLRAALKVVSAVGGTEALWLATSNSNDGLSGAMRSRFTDCFFFDLPDKSEREPIWQVWLDRYELDDKPHKDDEGWVGRNIKKCCEKAWRMDLPIKEAAAYITPVAVTEKEEIERLRRQANQRYLSASKAGLYRQPSPTTNRKTRAIGHG